eukprot:PhF_6_TR14959/c0_g1_i2/m.23479
MKQSSSMSQSRLISVSISAIVVFLLCYAVVSGGGGDKDLKKIVTPTPSTDLPMDDTTGTTRTLLYNSIVRRPQVHEGYFQQHILSPHKQKCEKQTATQQQHNRTVDLRIHFPSEIPSSIPCGSLHRFWIESLASDDGTVRCKGRDVIDVLIQSGRSRYAVERIMDLENGIYEVWWYVPDASLIDPAEHITICVDVVLTNLDDGVQFALNLSTLGKTYSMVLFQNREARAFPVACVINTTTGYRAEDRMKLNCKNIHLFPLCKRKSSAQQQILPLCTRKHKQISWPGSFHPPNREVTSQGWEHPLWYYPQQCRLRYWNQTDAETCLQRKWLLGWGDSTLKQALSNLLEYHLNFSVIPGIFMESYDRNKTLSRLEKLQHRQYRNPKRTRSYLPNFFRYRQWDRILNLTNKTSESVPRVTMAWGGCYGRLDQANPESCHPRGKVGLLNRDFLNETFTTSIAEGKRLPDMILLSHQLWQYPRHDEPFFIKLIKESLQWLLSYYDTAKQQYPLIIWNNVPTKSNEWKYNRCRIPPQSFDQHTSWTLHDYFHTGATESHRNAVVFFDRYVMTYPFHNHEDGFVHTGWHYGSTWGMCLTGLAHRRYLYDPLFGPSGGCAKKTYPEMIMTQAWLNMLCNP